jgi:MFS family permease
VGADARPGEKEVGRSPLVLVGLGTFLFWLSLYLYVPILPLHAQAKGASLTMVGAVVASYAIAQVLLRIPIGVGADMIGKRRPFAAGGALVCAVGGLGLALAPDPWTLFAARTVTGIGAAAWVAISVLYASHWRAERAPMAMATVMALTQVAQVLATLAGGVLADRFGSESTFYGGFAAGLAATAALFLAREPAAPSRAYSPATFMRVLGTPALLLVSGVSITVQFVTFSTSFGFVPVYAGVIGASKAEVGYITTAMFMSSAFGALVSGYAVQRAGYRGSILAAAIVVAVAMALVPAIGSVGLLGAGQALGGIGRGALNTLLIALALQSAGPAERATAMGVFQAIYAIGMLGGPIVSGAVADAYGLDSVFYLSAAVSVGGGLLAFASAKLTTAGRPAGN